MASNSSHVLADLIRRKIVRMPNLRPKTKLGQRTVSGNQEAVFQQLKGEYYGNPVKLQPFVDYLKGRILEDEALATAPEGIYTWILKRGHLYATGLMSNQEIGSLHVNVDVLTLHQENVAFIEKNTLKNRRGAEAKPVAAGEVLVRKGAAGGDTILYFNLQSGTYSEPMLKCRAVALGEQRGLNKKGLKGAMEGLKRECRDEIVEEVQEAMARSTGIPKERIRFLSCSDEIQRELEDVPLLKTGYAHGACRDDEDYLENVAGRNLIRRFMATTTAENMGRFQTYYYATPSASSASSAPVPSSSVLGKRPGNTRNSRGNQGNQKNQNNQNNRNKNQTRRKINRA